MYKLLVSEELWNDHKKLFLFPFSSAATCTNCPLEVDQRDEFRTCWGHVEELLVAEELWNDHKKLFFFPISSAATCTNYPLEVDQRFEIELDQTTNIKVLLLNVLDNFHVERFIPKALD
ncbi:hypothetical protein Taro_030154 [Colocasia esculenta]|uniref:Uncharacterized protein n=1 Tax=Colocasia esculenta TaxID=4460 RepID=A0A843VFM3_COLES|nr:hypothetical protein [Colocasia esculenta]